VSAAAGAGGEDDAARISRRFLASVREGDIALARVQLFALDDVLHHEPWRDLNELEAGKAAPGREPEAGQ